MPHNPYQGPLIPASCPPAPKVPLIKLLRPRSGETVGGISLSKEVTGFFLHYIDRLTIPCVGNRMLCPQCQHGRGRRWYGYLIVLVQPQHQFRLLEITEGCYRSCPALHVLSSQLDGRLVKLHRGRTSIRATVTATVSQTRVDYQLPPCPSIEDVLARIWGIAAKPPLEGQEQAARPAWGQSDGDAVAGN